MKKLKLAGLVAVGLIGCCSVVKADGTVTPPDAGTVAIVSSNPAFGVTDDLSASVAGYWQSFNNLSWAAYIANVSPSSDSSDKYKAATSTAFSSGDSLAGAYYDNLGSSEFGKFAVSNLLKDFEDAAARIVAFKGNSPSDMAQTAAEYQIKFSFLLSSQNNVIIQQNKQIIDLLASAAKNSASTSTPSQQNSVLVQQNKQIITLLTKIANKK